MYGTLEGMAWAGESVSGSNSGVIAGLALLGGAAVGATVGVVYFPFCIAKEVAKSPSKAEVAAAKASLERGLARLDFARDISRRLRTHALFTANRSVTDLGVVASQEGRVDLEPVFARGYDTILLLEVLGLPGMEGPGKFSVDRRYAMGVLARLRVFQRPGEEPVYDAKVASFDLEFQHTFLEWGERDGQEMILELRRGMDRVAEHFSEEVFLHYRADEDSP